MSISRALASLLVAVATVQLGAAHPTAVGDLVRHYWRAGEELRWRPSRSETDLADAIVLKRGSGGLHRAAAFYCKALAGEDTEKDVAAMIRCARRSMTEFNGDIVATADEEFATDGWSALPGALESVYLGRHSVAALSAIARLWMDGGPGETLAEVQFHMFKKSPSALAHMWSSSTPKQRQALASGIAMACDDDPRVISREVHNRAPDVRRLALAVIRECRRDSRSSGQKP